MAQYTYTNKQVNPTRLMKEIADAGLPGLGHIDTVSNLSLIYFSGDLTTQQKTLLDSVVAAHQLVNQDEAINQLYDSAMAFGNKVMRQFIIENIKLGITQRGLTNHVRKTLREIKDAVETGSLYDAITEIKSLNPSVFDDVILTPARMLAFRHKIETYLNVPLAHEWDDEETWQ